MMMRPPWIGSLVLVAGVLFYPHVAAALRGHDGCTLFRRGRRQCQQQYGDMQFRADGRAAQASDASGCYRRHDASAGPH